MKKNLVFTLIGFIVALGAQAKNTDAGFQCKVTYFLEFVSGMPSSISTPEKRATLKVTEFSKRWTYRIMDQNFEIMASQKQGDPHLNAWISELSSGHAILSHIDLKKWDGDPLFLSHRTRSNILVQGRKVTQVNLQCRS